MKLYMWLRTRVPNWVAMAVTALWLAALVIVAIFFAGEPQAEFRYGNL